MYCNQCGAQIGEGAVRCPACGKMVPAIAVEKRLVRPRHDRKIAGVCAAVANYFEIDVMLVRLIWLLAVIFAGSGLLAYVIAWIVIPEEPETVVVMRPQV
ncbi:MAG: PspC domain-containing protein [Acidobacteriaceae bacterium]